MRKVCSRKWKFKAALMHLYPVTRSGAEDVHAHSPGVNKQVMRKVVLTPRRLSKRARAW